MLRGSNSSLLGFLGSLDYNRPERIAGDSPENRVVPTCGCFPGEAAEPSEGCVERLAPGEAQPDAAVARQIAGAGQDEIPHSRERAQISVTLSR